MSEASQCPTCRTPMGKKLQPSLVVSSLLNELHVRCMNVGCYWTGRYDERHAHDARCSRNLRRCQDLKVQLEQACCILQAKDKEVSELKAIVEKLNGQNSKFEEKVKLQQLQLNAKQSMLDFKHQEADDLKSQLSQVMKQRNASHFGLHSLFPLLFLLLFLVHLWVFSDILPAVLGIRDCLLAPP
ncbi:NUP116 [Symbiodinium necroappetens]|uniref:NUP116 protein n=1 Tax=Symbiodinium necroappetens TaxID=1628268 RepID=A0A812LLF5_9DINO|nr:NUP116 [Symbiodinium necroappetens]